MRCTYPGCKAGAAPSYYDAYGEPATWYLGCVDHPEEECPPRVEPSATVGYLVADPPALPPSSPVAAPAGVPTSAGAIDQGAARQNAGKPPLHLVPLDGLVLVAWVLAFGAEKYSPRGWEQAAARGEFSWADCVRACLSHLSKLMAGQRLDPESGLPHVAHLACNAVFLCAMLARGQGRDDLPDAHDKADPLTAPAWPWTSADWAPGPAFHEAVASARAKRAG